MVVNFDHHRADRTGVPEVILAEPKQVIDFIRSVEASLEKNNKILVTRMNTGHVKAVQELKGDELTIEFDRYKRTAILYNGKNTQHKELDTEISKSPQVGIIAAGTSDVPIVEEICFTLKYLNIAFKTYIDVGVAGIHRHQEVLKQLQDLSTIKALIVVAGNEGALFSVIAGQTKLPMIAVPTSIGYGFGGQGETALKSALQSCAPGVVTVNIDNGFGAASFIAKLLQL